MKSASEFSAIYLHRDPIDFRKWIDGLVAVIKGEMQLDPFKSYLFLFTSRRRDRIKILYWDKTGFAIWYKRLEQDRFAWPRKADEKTLVLTQQQFEWLLDGYDFTKLRPHQELRFAAGF
jgi:transposase